MSPIPHGCSRARMQRGVTLIEQVMVIAIAAIGMGLAVPSMHALLSRDAARTAQLSYIGALRFARYTAAMKNTRTLFCPTIDGAHCSNSTHWAQGWLLGLDRNHDNQPDGVPLRVGTRYDQLHIRSSVARRRVAFQPSGSAAGSNLSLVMCPTDPDDRPLVVVVSNAGRVRGARATRSQAARCPAPA